MTTLKLDVTGQGTRKELRDALITLADSLWSNNDIDELYNIDGASYGDNIIHVKLIDITNE